MKVFWLTFLGPPLSALRLGMGVTAKDQQDAIDQARATTDAEIAHVRDVHGIHELEQDHVVPNMGNMLTRGIWFPLGMNKTQ